jgi:hypothetical protein
MKQVAHILTSTSVAGRVSDARALAGRLESLNVFDPVELVPAIFWNDEPAVAPFLSEYPPVVEGVRVVYFGVDALTCRRCR